MNYQKKCIFVLMSLALVKFAKGCYVGSKVTERSFSYITTSETTFEPGITSDWHVHENPHYSHILYGGSKEIRSNKVQVQTEGFGLYYFPGIPHQNTHYKPGTRIFNIELEEAFFDKHDVAIPSQEIMDEAKRPLNPAGLIRILKEHYFNDGHSAIAVEQLCVNLVADSVTPLKHYPEWTAQITTVLNDQWNAAFSLNELAGQVNLHPVTLSKYFSRYFGCSLGEYLRKIKTDRALALIRKDKQSLTDIAFECGFTDQSHFIKTFKYFTGMLPRQYKKL
jgi:AraC family transcriptional regulator